MWRRGLILALLVCCAAGPAHAAWVAETVASTGDQGQSARIAVDDNDRPHICWYDASHGSLMYGVRNFDGWETEEIDTGTVGNYCAIAINPTKDKPAIAYYDDSIDAALFAYKDDSDNWQYETIEDSADHERGRWISLAYTADGQAWASYHYDDGYLNDNGVRVAWRNGANSWSNTTPDSVDNVFGERIGSWTAIALSTAEQPAVAYRDDVWSNQKFAWLDGTGWHEEDVVDPADIDSTGEHTGIAMDIGDNPYISMYFSPLVGDDCAVILKKIAFDWQWDEIECGGSDTGKYSSIAIGSDQRPRVAYYSSGNLKYGSKQADGSWALETLASGSTGMFTSIDLDSRDAPHIAYYDAFAKDMKYVWDMPAPAVLTIDPDNGMNTAAVTGVAIAGATFTPTSTGSLYLPATDQTVPCTNTSVGSPFALTCDLDITGAWPGAWDVRVTNAAGTGVLTGGFQVNSPAPELTSATPNEAKNNNPAFTLSLGGTYFTRDMIIKLQSPAASAVINPTTQAIASLTSAEAVFDLTGAATGPWDIIITTPYGSDAISEGLNITCAAPVADFVGAPLSGPAPHTVNFFDNSDDYNGCRITNWEWDFGDGETDDVANPSHVFEEPGRYKIKLRVTGPGGSDQKVRNNYITVTGSTDDDTADDDTGDDDTGDDDDWIDDDDEDDDADDDTGGSVDDDTGDEARKTSDDANDSGGCGC